MFLPVFQNCPAAVIQCMQNARVSLRIAVCWFTHPGIFTALTDACKRGVNVTLVINFDQINCRPKGLDFYSLTAIANVFGHTGATLMHHKMAIIDEKTVITGSFNWTNSDQNDHVLLIESLQLADQFNAAFDALLQQCVPLPLLRDEMPHPVIFSQLFQPILWTSADIKKRVVSGAKAWLAIFKTPDEWAKSVQLQQHKLQLKRVPKSFPTHEELSGADLFRDWQNRAHIVSGTRALLTRYCLRVRPGDVFVAVSGSGALLGLGLTGDYPPFIEDGEFRRMLQWLTPEKDAPVNVNLSLIRQVFIPFKGSVLALLQAF